MLCLSTEVRDELLIHATHVTTVRKAEGVREADKALFSL